LELLFLSKSSEFCAFAKLSGFPGVSADCGGVPGYSCTYEARGGRVGVCTLVRGGELVLASESKLREKEEN
jgi:hypothetical protein